ERIPTINGLMMMFGGLGALTSTLPVELLLNITDWRGLFLGLAALTAVAAVALFFVVPEHPGRVADSNFRAQLTGLRQVLGDRLFWRLCPTAAITIGVSLSTQSLWLGPWLHDMQGLDALAVASHLMLAAAVMSLGYPLAGLLAQRATRL